MVLAGVLSLHAEVVSGKGRVTFLKDIVKKNADKAQFAVRFRDGASTGTVTFVKALDGSLNVTPQKSIIASLIIRQEGRPDKIVKLREGYFRIDEIGTVMVDENREDVFFKGEDIGANWVEPTLNMINPAAGDYLSLRHPFLSWDGVSFETSENFSQLQFEKERRFLEEIRFDYGFRTAKQLLSSRNPADMDHIWRLSHNTSTVSAGGYHPRQYPGKPKKFKIVTAAEKGTSFYVDYNRVLQYDAQKKTYFLFYLWDGYHDKISAIAASRDHVVIGTMWRRLVSVNRKTGQSRHQTLNEDIETLEIKDSTIVVNGNYTLELQ